MTVAERPAAPPVEPSAFEREVDATRSWMAGDRFAEIIRLYSPRNVVEQRGTIVTDYPVARIAADRLYARLRELFAVGQAVTTYGPYSPGQAVAMKRAGIEAIYLGGWATSAKGSATEDPGPDLASYPLSQVPDEAAGLVRALLAADRNQRFARSRMTAAERAASPEVDFSPLIIADADTGHGGDAHVRNLIRRFVEAGVPGYHIEDQKPGAKKCGHQGGKVLVPCDEQIKRLNAARLQLDVMQVAGIIVARTDAEAASLLDGGGDERDQPFILGVTRPDVPSYKSAYLALMQRLQRAGVDDLNGHRIYALSQAETAAADGWLEAVGLAAVIDEAGRAHAASPGASPEDALERVADRFLEAWERAAGLKTYGQAVAEAMAFRADEGIELEMSAAEWETFAAGASWGDARTQARQMGLNVAWDPDLAKTPEGYYQVAGGIDYAIAKSLAVAPFADLLWMETKTADLADARRFAEAIHAVHPGKMLAYNLSPSFNWDTTGMSDDEMRAFPEELGRMGFVFNFITYGGHQIDGLAAEEFATALRDDGMLALARLQRTLRLLESPVPDATDPRRRAAGRRRAHGRVGSDGDHEGNGRRLHAEAASGADRGADPAPGGLARALGDASRRTRTARGHPPSPHCGLGGARAGRHRGRRRAAGKRRVRHHRRPTRTDDPLDPRPEHARSGAAPEAADDAAAPLPRPSVPRLVGPLPHPHR